jgi:tetratricopeptide (TPR) repeat protein
VVVGDVLGTPAADDSPLSGGAAQTREERLLTAEERRRALERAEQLLHQGQAADLVAARRLYQSILLAEPNHEGAICGIARTLYQMGELQSAHQLATSMLARGRGQPELLVLRARILRDLGEADAALADLRKAEAMEPGNAQVYLVAGTILDAEKCLPEQAIECYSKAVAADPSLVEAYFYRALQYDLVGKEDAATLDFRRVVSLASPGSRLARLSQHYLGNLTP